MKIFCILADCDFDSAEVIGYVHSEEWAQQICLQHNKKKTGNDREWDYEAAYPLMTPFETLPIAYTHEVVFDKVSSRPLKFKMRNEPTRYTYFEKTGKLPPPTAFLSENGTFVRVVVSLDKNIRKQAETKAKAALAKFVMVGPFSREAVKKWQEKLLL